MSSAKYTPSEIEPKWQKYWAENNTFRIGNPGDEGFDASKPKYYILDMFPYPSGAGLHVGHPEGYTATDILARWKRMKGFNVLHPMGWDAYGLPAEQYAMQTGTHPAQTTQKNVDNMKRQIQSLGFSYDWSREVNTTDPHYYRWTQWIFLKLFNSVYDMAQKKARHVNDVVADLEAGKVGIKGNSIVFDTSAADAKSKAFGRQWSELDGDEQWKLLANHRLAYVSEAPVWWCEALGTVLANEEVIDGKSERGDHPCVKKPLRQWMLRITAYAERLIDDLEGLDWPDAIKLMQRHWIGKSEGAEVDFEVVARASVPAQNQIDGDVRAQRPAPLQKIRVFTTRPDTLYGATYMVLAPEHPLVSEITSPQQKAAVEAYIKQASGKSDLARTDLAKDKSGVFTGAYAFNPVYEDRNEPRAKIPIWIADYVLMGYGTGAIMAVPAHDERDAEFALKFKLPIVSVVMPPDEWLLENFDAQKSAQAGVKPETLQNLSELSKKSNEQAVNIAGAKKALRDLFIENPTAFKGFFVDDGTSIKSPAMDGLPTPEAKKKITAWLEEKKLGEKKITYRLRDWLFSRQRYWGEPFPIVWDAYGHARALVEEELPVELPEMSDFKPTGSTEPPLSKAKDWLNVHIDIMPDGMARLRSGAGVSARAIVEQGFSKYRRNLPHWRLEGAVYFVTWRVAQGDPELQPDERSATLATLKHFSGQRYDLMVYVVMNDHVHVIVRPFEGNSLESIVHSWKSFTTNQLRKTHGRQRVWQDEYFDRIIRNDEEYREKAKYILENPLKRWPDLQEYEWVGVGEPICAGAEARTTTAVRETNTMPQWAGSCWYFLRYLDAHNEDAPFSEDAEKYWMNVDLYVGGAEHAVLHLLYSRFWHKVLFDHGMVHTKEPFQKLFNQGMITAFAFQDDTGRLIPSDLVEVKGDGQPIIKETGAPAKQIVAKMSKALKNVVNPDEVVNEYGADTLRLYEMFMGPLDGSKPWNPRDVPGMFRFLRDVWRMIVSDDESKPGAGNLRMNLLPSASELIGNDVKAGDLLERELHKTIKGVTHDLERMAFNTAISKLMVFKNKVSENPEQLTRKQAERFVLLLAPFAPHIAEELWAKLRHDHTLTFEKWPEFDEALTQDATKELAVQVNGKVKAKISVAANASDDEVKVIARAAIEKELAGKTIVKEVVVPGRLVNIVVK